MPPSLPAVPDGFDPRRQRRRAAPPARTDRAALRAARILVDAETVIARLEEAGHTLLCLPRTGPTTALRQTRHQFVAEALEAYAADPVPPPPARSRPPRASRAWTRRSPGSR